MKAILLAGALALASAKLAFAQDPTAVALPYGDIVVSLLGSVDQLIVIAVGSVATWVIAKLPAALAAPVRMILTEQLLKRAVEYGIAATQGAAKGRTLSVNVANDTLAQAAQYAIDNGAPWLISWLGGENGVFRKLIARLDVDDMVYVTETDIGPRFAETPTA